MHLSVTCPQCSSKYQLDPSMRGKRMRCPNTLCRAIFEVRDDNDPAPAAKETPEPGPAVTTEAWQAPVLPEPVPQAPPEPIVTAPAPVKVKEAPPKPKPIPAEPKRPVPVRPKPVPMPEPADDFPADFPGDDAGTATPAPAVATEAWQPEAAPIAPPEPPPARRRRTALWIILSMMLVLGGIAAFGYWRIRTGMESNEQERYQHADDLYQKRDFAEASAAFQKMQRDFPDSPNHKKYRFLGELSDVREAVHASESADEMVKTLERVLQFESVYQGDPLLSDERKSDIFDALYSLSKELARLAERDTAPPLLARAKQTWAEAKKAAPASADLTQRERKLQEDWTRVEAAIADHLERTRVRAVLTKNAEHATAAAVAEAWNLVEKTKRQDDPEIRALLVELIKAHREQVKFITNDEPAKTPMVDDDPLPSLSVTPLLHAERAVNVSGAPILALARGVLYALEPAKGELLWARRVGIDTRVLPLRVPADAITPEMLLVLSSDRPSLSGVVAQTGRAIWQTPLSGACLAAPVRVDRQVLVPTTAGAIDEIEIAEGRRLGSYHVGQSLTLGGVRQPGSPLVYFPADDFCLYILNIKERSCANVLYTRHPAGSLPGLPTLLPGGKGGWLLWSQADGLDKTVIKPYALPITKHDQQPAAPVVHLASISAPPRYDPGRLAAVTETGMLSLWGIRQKGTRDPLLFPMLPSDFPLESATRLGRSEVAHADADTIWTIARGKLQRVETGFHPAKGPSALGRWTHGVPLGQLLHAVDARREPDGRTILYLTTQADERATCLASAVDGETGKILWQRQLGILPESPPRLVSGQIIVPGPEGVLRFEPTTDAPPPPWRQAGVWVAHEPHAGAERILLKSEDQCVQLSWRKGETVLRIGVLEGGDKMRTLRTQLPATVQGGPALDKDFVLLPLANGILVRISLADGGIVHGPDWRALGAEAETQGHVSILGGADFLVTDGSRGLQRLHIADGKIWDKRAELQLAHRIVTAPVVLNRTQAKKEACVLDASDTLTLVDADRLTVLRNWQMPGKVTAGPFVRAGKIGCVVAKNRLVWIDPSEKTPAWEYAFVADVVGAPHLMDGMLVVGDIAGQFVALDPATGRPLGPDLTLKANLAPVAAPLPFGPGRAFAPLTDGTIVIVPLDKLRP